MKVVVRGTIIEKETRQPVSMVVDLPAAPEVGDRFRMVGGYTDVGSSAVAARFWHADGTLELQLEEVEWAVGMSSSILAGQGWELRG